MQEKWRASLARCKWPLVLGIVALLAYLPEVANLRDMAGAGNVFRPEHRLALGLSTWSAFVGRWGSASTASVLLAPARGRASSLHYPGRRALASAVVVLHVPLAFALYRFRSSSTYAS
jgi:hypothetical protein